MLEFIERLDSDHDEERWLVHAGGNANPHVAWIFRNEERDLLETLADQIRPMVGPIHPRVSTIIATNWHRDQLVIEVDDDRGPAFSRAAKELEDPIERERWAVAQTIAIADGLAAMRGRDRKFVYREVDVENVFVDIAGRARLRAPVGLVKFQTSRNRMGAGVLKRFPPFMSPEQVRGEPVGAATDVFALAGVLYLALSGQKPFRGESDFELLEAIYRGSPTPITTQAPDLWPILERAFVKDPKARIPDPGAFAGELWQCIPDAVDYDECISDRIVAWRANAPNAERSSMWTHEPCKMKWQELAPTNTSDVRHCGSCKQDVVQVTSIAKVLPLVGRCLHFFTPNN